VDELRSIPGRETIVSSYNEDKIRGLLKDLQFRIHNGMWVYVPHLKSCEETKKAITMNALRYGLNVYNPEWITSQGESENPVIITRHGYSFEATWILVAGAGEINLTTGEHQLYDSRYDSKSQLWFPDPSRFEIVLAQEIVDNFITILNEYQSIE